MPSPVVTPGARGVLVPIGGAEDRISDRRILQRFAQICGGPNAAVAVIPTASDDPSTGDAYARVFTELGAGRVAIVGITDRRDAADPKWCDLLDAATGIFLTGGSQLKLSTILGGTPVATRVRRLHASGVHVAGTSAGAAFLCEHMIAHGAAGATPRAGMVALAPGLGLTNRIIIDQHFRERDRLGRLLAALSYNPFPVGFGLDEDTAAFVDPYDEVEVMGAGAITVVDELGVSSSGMATAEPGQPVELIGVRLHVLPGGARYSLNRRAAYPSGPG
jgi:cyanophycinase